jgi:hypothetical protein
MPEAPTKADALVASENKFAADPADGEFEKRGVASGTCEACGASDDLRRTLGNMIAEGAGENVCMVRI